MKAIIHNTEIEKEVSPISVKLRNRLSTTGNLLNSHYSLCFKTIKLDDKINTKKNDFENTYFHVPNVPLKGIELVSEIDGSSFYLKGLEPNEEYQLYFKTEDKRLLRAKTVVAAEDGKYVCKISDYFTEGKYLLEVCSKKGKCSFKMEL